MASKQRIWLKSIGTGEDPLPDKWLALRPEILELVPFKTRPAIASGDLIVYYASGRKKLFAVAKSSENGSSAEMDLQVAGQRWPYVLHVQTFVVIPDLRLAPDYDVLGKSSRAVQQQSHIELSDAEYRQFLEALPQRIAV